MGKKQMRTQMRKIKPKVGVAGSPPGQHATRRQRERYVQAGGMLQGYAPDFVIRLGYASLAIGAWAGWMAHLPTQPSDAAQDASRR